MTTTLENVVLEDIDAILANIENNPKETQVNVPLLRKAVEWAEAESKKSPLFSEWYQGSWVIDSVETRAEILAAKDKEVTDLERNLYSKIDDLEFYSTEWTDARNAAREAILAKRKEVAERIVREINASETRCGTAYCVAGWVAAIHNPAFEKTDVVNDVHSASYAQAVLGLNNDQADELFDGANSIEDIRRISERFAGERL